MTKKIIRKKQQATSRRYNWLWAGAAALLLVVAGVVIWNRFGGRTTALPQVIGAPHLVVDHTTVDEGDVKLGKSIQSAFRLQNVGDQTLQILDEPQVEVMEGC